MYGTIYLALTSEDGRNGYEEEEEVGSQGLSSDA